MGDSRYLTGIIVNDPEKDPKLLEYCFQSIRDLNPKAIPDTQFIVLNQDPDGSDAYELAKAQPFDVDWIDAGYECVGGVVLWDLMDSMRRLMPRVEGRYHHHSQGMGSWTWRAVEQHAMAEGQRGASDCRCEPPPGGDQEAVVEKPYGVVR